MMIKLFCTYLVHMVNVLVNLDTKNPLAARGSRLTFKFKANLN